MNIPSRITLDDLRNMQVSAIAALSGKELAPLQLEADEQLRNSKNLCDWLDRAIALKYGERAKEARRTEGKNTGTIRFNDCGLTIVADLPKRIDWDQHELTELVERIKAEGENPRDYVEVSLKVSERKYAAWPPHIRKVFEPARTVRTGKETFQLISGDA